MSKTLSVAIIGASGYTGAELIRLLLPHPGVTIALLTGDSQAGKPMEAVYPHLGWSALPPLVSLEQANFSGIDVAFCCLPHGTTQEVVAGLPESLCVIDLSADFRLADPQLYAQWYGHAHKAGHLQPHAVYGLTELARERIKTARLIANPGCYPTSALLPLMPLLSEGLVAPQGMIIDSKSGVTGAGRSAKQANLFCEVDGGFSVYGIASHRHSPEIEQGLSSAAGKPVSITFTPHLLPMSRGILSTIYLHMQKDAATLRAGLETAYAGETFVHILPAGRMPSTQMVRGSNHCVIGVFDGQQKGQAVVVSVIDNLVKGASGQAVQNMNLRFGFAEDTGLSHTAMFP